MPLTAHRVFGSALANFVKFNARSSGFCSGIFFGTAIFFSLVVAGCGGGGSAPQATPSSPIANEGTPQDPVLLALDTPFRGQVAAGGTSYYAFQISQSGNYEIRLTDTQSNLGWELEVSPGYGIPGTIASCDAFPTAANEVCRNMLSLFGFPQIQYQIKVIEQGATAGRFTLSVSGIPPTPYLDCTTFQTFVNPVFDSNLAGTTCSASSCHAISGTSGGAFKLYPNALPNSPEMQANFLAAKGFSDLANPAQSKLLLEPLAGAQPAVGAHAGGDNFASSSDPNYVTLFSWITNQLSVPNNCYP